VEISKIIDLESKISQVETHRQKNMSASTAPFGIFLIFQTVGEIGHFWWSLETFSNHVFIQRSRDKEEVKRKFKGKTREETEPIAEKLEGTSCMRELLTLLWIHMILELKSRTYLSRCESIIPFVIQKITKMCYEYGTDFNYSALSAEEKSADLTEVVDLLSNMHYWHPLVITIYLGDIESLDKLKHSRKFNINGIYNNYTLLNLAILFSKTELMRHLQEKWKADGRKCDKKGRNALHMAAKFNGEKKILNSLLKNIFIDQCDATGTTALHHAIMTSNTEIVQCLLDNGADPNKQDQIGRWPLHAAAFYATDTKIIDFLLQKKEVVGVNDCDKFGVAALHNAAMASNKIMVAHLLASGADINCRDKNGITPFHVAVKFAKDMELIDLFLNNKKINLQIRDKFGQNVIAYVQKNSYGLQRKAIHRLKEIDASII
jgi:ankyrin repeat protein